MPDTATLNAAAVLIASLLFLRWLIEATAELLNIVASRQPVPDEFADLVTEATHQKMVSQNRDHTIFGLQVGGVGLTITVALLVYGGFAWWDDWVRRLAWSSIGSGLLFLGGLAAASQLLAIPAALYRTYVIEERYGFNRTTLATFVLDRLKGALLAIVLGGGILALILWLLTVFSQWGWLYGWLALTIIELAMSVIAPWLILPMFNTFTPLPDGELKEQVTAFAQKVNFPFAGLYLMDGSKRSSRANAFFAGLGKKRRIVLFDTLVANHTTKELVAVLAHEVGHNRLHHIPKTLLTNFALNGLRFGLLGLFFTHPAWQVALGFAQPSAHLGLLLFGLLYSPLDLLLAFLQCGWSRHHEFEADAFAARTADPEALALALKKLSVDNLSNLTPHPFKVALSYDHPPVVQRIRLLTARSLSPGQQ